MARPTERQLAALVEAGMILGSDLNLDTLLQRIADLSREVLGAAYAAVGVLGDDGELARFVYAGIDPETAARIGDLPQGRGVLGILIEQGRPLRLREISQHPRSFGFPPHHPPMHSFLGVPIVVKQRVFGRLYLAEKRGAAEFSKDDERIAITLASQAGIAVENAHLLDELQKHTEEITRRVAQLSSVQLIGRLAISAPVDETLQSVVDEARHLTSTTRAVAMLLDEATGDLIVRKASGKGFPPGSLIGTRIPAGTSKAHAVLQRGAGELIQDVARDAEIDPETTRMLGNPRSGAVVPLAARSGSTGALAVYDRTDGLPLGEADLAILQVLGNLAAIAVENDRLTSALTDIAVLEERDRISKELHDGVIQSIYSVGLSLQAARSTTGRDPDRTAARIEAAISELDNVVRDVRSYIFALQPLLTAGRDLGDVLMELAKDHEVNTLVPVDVAVDEGLVGLLSQRQLAHVVQIAREVLSNIARHAGAANVKIRALRQGPEMVLTFADDGTRFDPGTVTRGHGLDNVDDRAKKLRGTMTIRERPGAGMIHELRIPLRERQIEQT